MESLTILSRSSRSKKLEVKGGFYSKDDMKNELGYVQPLESKFYVDIDLIDCPG